MTPRELISDPKLKKQFEDLCCSVLIWETSWDCIDSSYFQIYSRRMPDFEATNTYVKRKYEQFKQTGTPLKVYKAVDLQRITNSRAKFSKTTSDSLVSKMNHGLKDPQELLFYVREKYTATINGEGYAQSHLLLMDVLPTEEQIKQKSKI